jgi:GntR family transcriptional regulator
VTDLSLPVYKQIEMKITERIYNGEYPVKSFLPSENEFAKEFEVTRKTIRKALNVLKEQGTIESFPGKGYKVSSFQWEQSLLQFYSFGRNIASDSQKHKTKLINLDKINGLKDIDEVANKQLWKITRLRIIDGIPLILETSYIPQELMPTVNEESVKQNSLYDILEEKGVNIIKAKEYLEPVLPSLEAQQLMDIDNDQPLFQTLRYTYNSNSEIIEIRESLIRGDHFCFSVEMTL